MTWHCVFLTDSYAYILSRHAKANLEGALREEAQVGNVDFFSGYTHISMMCHVKIFFWRPVLLSSLLAVHAILRRPAMTRMKTGQAFIRHPEYLI